MFSEVEGLWVTEVGDVPMYNIAMHTLYTATIGKYSSQIML